MKIMVYASFIFLVEKNRGDFDPKTKFFILAVFESILGNFF